jgi:hypothetical protein
MLVLTACLGLFAVSTVSFAASLFDETDYYGTDLDETTYLGTRTYKYDDLGVNW